MFLLSWTIIFCFKVAFCLFEHMFLISLFISPGKSLLFFRFIFVRNEMPYRAHMGPIAMTKHRHTDGGKYCKLGDLVNWNQNHSYFGYNLICKTKIKDKTKNFVM